MDSLHRNDDLEADAPRPEDIGCSAIEEPRRRSFFNGQKKVIAAVFSIFVVAAVATGVALSAKLSQQTVLEQSSDTITGSEDAQEQHGIDGEKFDINDHQVFSTEYPEDIIYDVGHASEEPEMDVIEMVTHENQTAIASEKVQDDGEDIETAEFDGPLTDFIVTPEVSRINKATNGQCENPNEGLWYLQFVTDKYPWENSWQFKDADGTVVMSGPPEGKNYARMTTYIGSMCVEAGEYTMELKDKSGDGVCCIYGNGKMFVKVNGKTVMTTDDSNFSSLKETFVISPLNQDVVTSTPTKKPTVKPSDSAAETPSGQHSVVISVKTDQYGAETGYTFKSQDGEILINKEKGTLDSDTLYETKFLVDEGKGLTKGQYSLTIKDDVQGIAAPGFYAVEVDGVEVMFDHKSNTYMINVGIEPSMTELDMKWLTAHNSRREKFYEAGGVPNKPLVWSTDLKEAASNWVDQITPTCKPMIEEGLIDGENLSTRTANAERNETPEVILKRWVDRNVGKGYPENQSMTQVLWRGTRYVGCAQKVTQRSDGSICYVSICRYARAGNCALNSDNWKEITLGDRSGCGRACPGDLCY
ncbi:hypothetical protein ACHAXA_000993 [Cyclostephanos tholiformis]|uniref:SCP domain-containing protein n=1 Tax=Cyclostephanos tholiformis TaxID=382380 RepID=A0ABD3SDY1_9STRA